MELMEGQQLAGLIAEACREAGQFIRNEFGRTVLVHAEEKSHNSLVSRVDREAEQMLVVRLSSLVPGAGFLTEEETSGRLTERHGLVWVIDPLDGTTNFLYGIPAIAVSVALKQDDITVAGCVYDIMQDKAYTAWRGGGAWLEGHRLEVSRRTSLSGGLVATGFPYEAGDFLPRQMRALEYFIVHTRGVRRLGSAALDLAYVAAGNFDLYFEFSLSEWDTAAGMLLVREAGGVCSDLGGDKTYNRGEEILACSPQVFEEALAVIRNAETPG